MSDSTSTLKLSETEENLFQFILLSGSVTLEMLQENFQGGEEFIAKTLEKLTKLNLIRVSSDEIPKFSPFLPLKQIMQILETIEAHNQTNIQNLQELHKASPSKFEEMAKRITENFTGTLDELASTIQKSEQKTSHLYEQSEDTSQERLKGTLIQHSDTTKSIVEKNLETMKDSIDAINSQVHSDLQNINSEITGIKESIPEALEKSYSDALNSEMETMESINSQVKASAQAQVQKYQGDIQKFLGEIHESIEQLRRNNQTVFQSSTSTMNSLFKDINSLINLVMNNSISNTQQLVNKVKNETRTVLNQFLEQHLKAADNFSGNVTQDFTDLKIEIEKSLQDLQSQLTEQAQYQYMEAKRRLLDNSHLLEEKSTKLKEIQIHALTALLDKIEENITSIIDTINSDIDEGNKNLIESVQNKLAHQTTNFAEFANEILNEYKQMNIALEIELNQEISEKLNEIRGTTLESVEEFSTRVGLAKKNIKRLINTNEAESLGLFNSNIQLVEKDYEKVSKTLKKHIDITKTKISDTYSSAFNQSQENLFKFSNLQKQNSSDIILNTVAEVINTGDAASQTFRDQTNAQFEDVKQNFAKLSKSLLKSIEEGKTKTEELLVDYLVKIDEIGLGQLRKIKELLEASGNEIQNTISQEMDALKDVQDGNTIFLLQSFESVRSKISTVLSHLQATISDKNIRHYQETKKNLTELLDSHSKELSNIVPDITTALSEIHMKEHDIFQGWQKEIEDLVNGLKQDIGVKLSANQEFYVKTLSNYFDNTISQLNLVQSLSTESRNILENAWKNVDTEINSLSGLFWAVRGTENVYSYLKESFNAASKAVALIIPSVNTFPLAELRNEQAIITILAPDVNDLSESLQHTLDNALGSQRLKLFEYRGSDCLVMIRDNTEVIISSLNSNKHPENAIISNFGKMVELMDHIVQEYANEVSNAPAISESKGEI